jgi:hypothetical protein
VAILTTDRDWRLPRFRRKAGNERRGRTDHKIDRGKAMRAGNNFLQLRDRGFQSIHFPVRGN